MLHAIGEVNTSNLGVKCIICSPIKKFQAAVGITSGLLNHQVTYEKHCTTIKQKEKWYKC